MRSDLILSDLPQKKEYKMSRYRRLTQKDRYQIEALVQSKISLREMAKIIGFSASTLSRELRRNRPRPKYFATTAQSLSQKRRKFIGPAKKITDAFEDHVREHILMGWSPEQIACRLKEEQGLKISHESIYKYIYDDHKYRRGSLWQSLRRHRRWRKTHKASRNFKNIGKKTDCLWISQRPKIVEKRSRLGDLERDTMLGKRGGPALLVFVDRASRLTRIRYLERLKKELTHEATLEVAKTLEVKTITNDNGGEFGCYKETAERLNVPIYFCKPYRSCERGTNENTIGLIRQYFPKYEHPNPQRVQEVEDLLNNRPRKCLGFRTPLEVHKQMSAVALSA